MNGNDPDDPEYGRIAPRFMKRDWQQGAVHPGAIHFHWVHADQEDSVCPFTLVPYSMARATWFIALAAALPPNIFLSGSDFGGVNLHRHQEATPYLMTFGSARDLLQDSADPTIRYPVRIIGIEGEVSEALSQVFRFWAIKPIFLVESNVSLERLRNFCEHVFTTNTATPSNIASALNALVLGTGNGGNTSTIDNPAIRAIASNPAKWKLKLRGCDIQPISPSLPTRALISHRYRCAAHFSDLPATMPSQVVALARHLDNYKQLEWEISRIAHAKETPPDIDRDKIRDFLASDRSPERFISLAAETKRSWTESARDGLILHIPVFNEGTFRRNCALKVNDRTIDYFKKGEGGQTPEERERELPDVERGLFRDLAEMWKETNQFVLASLAIYGIDTQAPVLPASRVSDTFIRRYEEIRKLYAKGSHAACSAKLASYGKDLAAALAPDYIGYLRGVRSAIRVISDLPIEWLEIDGIPLQYRCKVSRLPATQGNSLLMYLAEIKSVLKVDRAAMSTLLIIDCLSAKDHLADRAQVLARRLSADRVSFCYRKASSLVEYQEILNSCRPFTLIHVGHGFFEAETGHSKLCFGTEWRELRELQKGTHVPAIVILAACETLPGSSERSAARTYLSFGSRAVVSTSLSVHADLTLAFVSNILHVFWKISGELDKGPATWGDVVWIALMKSYLNDAAYLFNEQRQRKGLATISPEDIQVASERWRNANLRNDVFQVRPESPGIEHFLSEVVRARDPKLADSFNHLLKSGLFVPHSLFFSHLGFPDTLSISA